MRHDVGPIVLPFTCRGGRRKRSQEVSGTCATAATLNTNESAAAGHENTKTRHMVCTSRRFMMSCAGDANTSASRRGRRLDEKLRHLEHEQRVAHAVDRVDFLVLRVD